MFKPSNLNSFVESVREYDLRPRYDARASFYGKAVVVETKNYFVLKSYHTIVAAVDKNTKKPYVMGSWSQTTTRHQLDFIRQFSDEYPKNSKDLKKYFASTEEQEKIENEMHNPINESTLCASKKVTKTLKSKANCCLISGTRTVGKEVTDKIRQYLTEACEVKMDEDSTDTPLKGLDAVRGVYELFKKEYGHQIRRMGEQNAFKEWLRGLALPIDFDYYTEKKLVKEWLNQTDEEADKYKDYDTDKLYWNLLTREFFRLLRKAGGNNSSIEAGKVEDAKTIEDAYEILNNGTPSEKDEMARRLTFKDFDDFIKRDGWRKLCQFKSMCDKQRRYLDTPTGITRDAINKIGVKASAMVKFGETYPNGHHKDLVDISDVDWIRQSDYKIQRECTVTFADGTEKRMRTNIKKDFTYCLRTPGKYAIEWHKGNGKYIIDGCRKAKEEDFENVKSVESCGVEASKTNDNFKELVDILEVRHKKNSLYGNPKLDCLVRFSDGIPGGSTEWMTTATNSPAGYSISDSGGTYEITWHRNKNGNGVIDYAEHVNNK